MLPNITFVVLFVTNVWAVRRLCWRRFREPDQVFSALQNGSLGCAQTVAFVFAEQALMEMGCAPSPGVSLTQRLVCCVCSAIGEW
jgi:hypothetical protein